MVQKLKNFVNGKPSESQTQRWGDVYNPAAGQCRQPRTDVDRSGRRRRGVRGEEGVTWDGRRPRRCAVPASSSGSRRSSTST